MKYIIPFVLILISCASVQQLDGGDKDTIAPKVVSTYPDSGSLNINSTSFNFIFDEYIATTNISELLIISPSQKKPPKVEIKGKKLTIQLNDILQDSTTYTIQFNGSIIDINESNPIDNYNYIFSTGTYLDSLTASGVVIDILTNKPCDACNVHLYKDLNDSLIINNKPDYVTKTDKNGKYKFTNLPFSTYNIVALLDKNKNLKLDKDESVTLSQEITTGSDSTYSHKLFPNENNDKYKLDQISKKVPGIITIISNKPLQRDSLKLYINDSLSSYSISQSKDTITTYYTPTRDTTSVLAIYSQDSFNFKYILNLSSLKYSLNLSNSLNDRDLILKSKTPILKIDTTKIKIYADSQLLDILKYTIYNTQVKIRTNTITENNTYQLLLEEGALTDVLNQISKSDTIDIKPATNHKSSLALSLTGTNSLSYIISLKQGKTLIYNNYISSDTSILYNNLKPGTYKLEIIQDRNQNGIWDTGDFISKKEPESIQLSDDIEIRENWDKELIINVK